MQVLDGIEKSTTKAPARSGAGSALWLMLPKKLEGLTFRALISVDDYWPLEVRVPVRNVQ